MGMGLCVTSGQHPTPKMKVGEDLIHPTKLSISLDYSKIAFAVASQSSDTRH